MKTPNANNAAEGRSDSNAGLAVLPMSMEIILGAFLNLPPIRWLHCVNDRHATQKMRRIFGEQHEYSVMHSLFNTRGPESSHDEASATDRQTHGH